MQNALYFLNEVSVLAAAEASWWSWESICQFVNDTMKNPTWFFIISTLIKVVISLCLVIPLVPISVLIERRGAAVIQDRVGPNRAYIPFTLANPILKMLHLPQFKKDRWALGGLLQPAIDGGKLFLKEDFTPPYVRKGYFWLAPVLVLIPSLITISVIPMAGDFFTPWGNIKMVVADINAGPIFIFAIASFSVYGITLAGWASNSKYPFLGGVRSTAQMISYEICLGLAIIPLLMIFRELNLSQIVQYQADNGWMLLPLWGEGLTATRWLLLIPIVISFLVFTASMFAEANRTPFDMAECETDLVGGYHTEYSSMKFALFFMGEYAAMVVGSALIITMFLGGWSIGFGIDGWMKDALGQNMQWVGSIAQLITFAIKLLFFITFFVWVRWTLPRFRYDQVMKLGWLVFFEVAVINIFITAAILYLTK